MELEEGDTSGMALEKGNNENKRKREKDEEGSAKKLLLSDSLTFSGTGQNGQGQEETNWMKYCKTVDKIPQCTICAEEYCFFIDSKLFEVHLKSEHIKNYLIRRDTPNWIFTYFDHVPETHLLKCRMCGDYTGKVQFEGPFVRHFYADHDEIAKQNDELSQGSQIDAEITVKSHTSKFIDYLFGEYLDWTNTAERKVQEYIIQKTWWRSYIKTDICDTDDMRNTILCNICEKPFHVSINSACYQNHMNRHHKGTKIKDGNMWFRRNFKFVPNIILCKLCYTPLNLQLNDKFETHLKEEHNIKPGDEPIVTRNKKINCFLFQSLRNSFKNHELTEKIVEGNEATEAVGMNGADTQDIKT